MNPRIFITYNPHSEIEQATALRLQTIARLYHVDVMLPDRLGYGAKENTKERIRAADYVIAFRLRKLESIVLDELIYSQSIDKQIIIVNNKDIGNASELGSSNNIMQVQMDLRDNNQDKVLHSISKFVRDKTSVVSQKEVNNGSYINSFLAFLAILLGTIALASLVEDSQEPKKRKGK